MWAIEKALALLSRQAEENIGPVSLGHIREAIKHLRLAKSRQTKLPKSSETDDGWRLCKKTNGVGHLWNKYTVALSTIPQPTEPKAEVTQQTCYFHLKTEEKEVIKKNGLLCEYPEFRNLPLEIELEDKNES